MRKIFNSFSQNKKRWLGAAVFVLLIVTTIYPLQARAGYGEWACGLGLYIGTKAECLAGMKGIATDIGSFVFDNTIGAAYVSVAGLVLTISNVIFFFAGWLIDALLPLFTADLSHTDGVIAGWSTFRDISNLFFIFIMLVISIATILRIESYGAKSLLARVVIVALLINFSLPISRAIIDVNNAVASVFYKQLTTKNADGTTGVSAKINALTGVASVFSGTTLKTFLDKNNTEGQMNTRIGTIFLGISGVLLVSSFVFLAFAVMLIIRTIYLGFLVMLSPLAFFGMILPYTQGYAKQWWEKLIKQSLIAPVGFMMLYVAINILKKMSATGFTQVNDLGGVFAGDQAQFPMLLNFMTVTGVLIGALYVTQSLGAVGASTAIAWGGAAYKGAKGYAGSKTRAYTGTLMGKAAEGFGGLGKEGSWARTFAQYAAKPLAYGARIGEKDRAEKKESLAKLSDGVLKAQLAATTDNTKREKLQNEIDNRKRKKARESAQDMSAEDIRTAQEKAAVAGDTVTAKALEEQYAKRLKDLSLTDFTAEEARVRAAATTHPTTHQSATAAVAADGARRSASTAQTTATSAQTAAINALTATLNAHFRSPPPPPTPPTP